MDLGEDPITLGLWVGPQTPIALMASSKFSWGRSALRTDAGRQFPENPFSCWHVRVAAPGSFKGAVFEKEEHYGIRVNASSFSMFCPDEDCLLHESIPVSVMEVTISTNGRRHCFWCDRQVRQDGLGSRFESVSGQARRTGGVLPPSLIVQDNSILITGPLGTIAGVYRNCH